MQKVISSIILLIITTGWFSTALLAQKGKITGRVYDQSNNEPLPFTNLVIYGTQIGSTSDLDGKFTFTGLEPGYVSRNGIFWAIFLPMNSGAIPWEPSISCSTPKDSISGSSAGIISTITPINILTIRKLTRSKYTIMRRPKRKTNSGMRNGSFWEPGS